MAKRSKNRKRAHASHTAATKVSTPAAAFSWLVLAQAVVIVLAALWIYGPAVHGDWLWDDDLLVTSNPHLRSVHGLFEIWFASSTSDYWPLTWTLLWIEWHLWGADSFGYHAVSLALHISSGFLLWRLLCRLGLRWGWLGALFFVIHPVMVESVAWVAEIKNTFSLPFFLLAFDAWLDAEEGKRFAYGKSILFYLAAMLAKSSTVMLPAVLLLYCWWKRQTITRHEVVRMIPYAVIAVTLGVITIYLQNPAYFRLAGPLAHPVDVGGPLVRIVRAGASALFYLGCFLWPFGLVPLYPRSAPESSLWIFAMALTGLAGIFVCLWRRWDSWGRHALFGFGFFLITLLPVLGLVKMKYFEIAWVADHLVYLPVIGLIALLTAVLESLSQRLKVSLRPFGVAALALLAIGLGWLSRDYASLFASEEGLWAYTVQGNPGGELPRNNLANAYLHEARYADAIKQYELALEANTDDAEAYCNIGVCYIQTGQMDKAEEALRHSLKIEPGFADAHANLGGVLLQQGRLPEAVDEFQQALRSNPENTSLRFELGAALLGQGRAAEAMEQFTEVQSLDPTFPHLGEALAQAQQRAASPHP